MHCSVQNISHQSLLSALSSSVQISDGGEGGGGEGGGGGGGEGERKGNIC